MDYGDKTIVDSGNNFSSFYRLLHQGFAVVMLMYLVSRQIVVVPLLGVLFYGVVVPAVCVYHVVGAQRDWLGTSGYAAVLFGIGTLSWALLYWYGSELGAFVSGTVFVVAGLGAVSLELLPYLRRK